MSTKPPLSQNALKGVKEQKITPKKALELYRTTLNFNVISRYDQAIKQLLYYTSYCVVYKFNSHTSEWIKTDFQGTLALYLRHFNIPPAGYVPSFQDLQNIFCYGLILLNRNNPECFSLGLLPNKIIKHYYPHGFSNNNACEIAVELNDNLIIVKTLVGQIYGLWVFDPEERTKLFKLMQFCLSNDSSML